MEIFYWGNWNKAVMFRRIMFCVKEKKKYLREEGGGENRMLNSFLANSNIKSTMENIDIIKYLDNKKCQSSSEHRTEHSNAYEVIQPLPLKQDSDPFKKEKGSTQISLHLPIYSNSYEDKIKGKDEYPQDLQFCQNDLSDYFSDSLNLTEKIAFLDSKYNEGELNIKYISRKQEDLSGFGLDERVQSIQHQQDDKSSSHTNRQLISITNPLVDSFSKNGKVDVLNDSNFLFQGDSVYSRHIYKGGDLLMNDHAETKKNEEMTRNYSPDREKQKLFAQEKEENEVFTIMLEVPSGVDKIQIKTEEEISIKAIEFCRKHGYIEDCVIQLEESIRQQIIQLRLQQENKRREERCEVKKQLLHNLYESNEFQLSRLYMQKQEELEKNFNQHSNKKKKKQVEFKNEIPKHSQVDQQKSVSAKKIMKKWQRETSPSPSPQPKVMEKTFSPVQNNTSSNDQLPNNLMKNMRDQVKIQKAECAAALNRQQENNFNELMDMNYQQQRVVQFEQEQFAISHPYVTSLQKNIQNSGIHNQQRSNSSQVKKVLEQNTQDNTLKFDCSPIKRELFTHSGERNKQNPTQTRQKINQFSNEALFSGQKKRKTLLQTPNSTVNDTQRNKSIKPLQNQSNINQTQQNQSFVNQTLQNHSNVNQIFQNHSNVNQTFQNQSNINQPQQNQSNLNYPLQNQLNFNQPLQNQSDINQSLLNQLNVNQPLQNQLNVNQSLQNQLNVNYSLQNQSNINQPLQNQLNVNQSQKNQLNVNQHLQKQLNVNQSLQNQSNVNKLLQNQSNQSKLLQNQSNDHQSLMNNQNIDYSLKNQSNLNIPLSNHLNTLPFESHSNDLPLSNHKKVNGSQQNNKNVNLPMQNQTNINPCLQNNQNILLSHVQKSKQSQERGRSRSPINVIPLQNENELKVDYSNKIWKNSLSSTKQKGKICMSRDISGKQLRIGCTPRKERLTNGTKLIKTEVEEQQFHPQINEQSKKLAEVSRQKGQSIHERLYNQARKEPKKKEELIKKRENLSSNNIITKKKDPQKLLDENTQSPPKQRLLSSQSKKSSKNIPYFQLKGSLSKKNTNSPINIKKEKKQEHITMAQPVKKDNCFSQEQHEYQKISQEELYRHLPQVSDGQNKIELNKTIYIDLSQQNKDEVSLNLRKRLEFSTENKTPNSGLNERYFSKVDNDDDDDEAYCTSPEIISVFREKNSHTERTERQHQFSSRYSAVEEEDEKFNSHSNNPQTEQIRHDHQFEEQELKQQFHRDEGQIVSKILDTQLFQNQLKQQQKKEQFEYSQQQNISYSERFDELFIECRQQQEEDENEQDGQVLRVLGCIFMALDRDEDGWISTDNIDLSRLNNTILIIIEDVLLEVEKLETPIDFDSFRRLAMKSEVNRNLIQYIFGNSSKKSKNLSKSEYDLLDHSKKHTLLTNESISNEFSSRSFKSNKNPDQLNHPYFLSYPAFSSPDQNLPTYLSSHVYQE